MDQVDFQEASGYPAPVLFNWQQGDDPDTLTYGFYSDPIATDDPSQAVDLTYYDPLFPGSIQPRDAGLPSNSAYTNLRQSPDANLLSAGLPSSSAYTDFGQFPGASLSPANYADFPDFVQSRGAGLFSSPAYTDPRQSPDANLLSAGLPSSSAYTDFGQFPGASLSPANYVDFLDFIESRGAGLASSPAYVDFRQPSGATPLLSADLASSSANTDFRQSPGASLSPANHAGFSGFVPPPSAGLCLSSADSRQSSGASFDSNHANYRSCCIMNTSNGESRCLPCAWQGIPASVCIVVTLTTPFVKCLEKKYPLRHTSIQASGFCSSKTVQLGHYPNGPTLTVECCQFIPTDIIQTSVLRNNRYGCNSMRTTAWCLKNPTINISLYLQDCVTLSKTEACARQHPQLLPLFELARDYYDIPIIQQCWWLFAIIRLLRLGWDFSGNESLGMVTVKEKKSVFYGFKHVPRMLRDQLNHALELKMMELDTQILKGARDILENGKRPTWVVGYLVLFFLLRVREVYAGRLLIWKDCYTELADFWLHTSSPTALIDEIIASCNSILLLFHFSIGPKLLYVNWDDPKNIVDVNSDFVKSMRKLQIHARQLRTDGFIGQMACNLYKAGDPNSVDLTVCSLLFGDPEKGREVKGFY